MMTSPRKFHRKSLKLKISEFKSNEPTSSMAGSNIGQSGDGSNVGISREEFIRLMGVSAPIAKTFQRNEFSSVSKPRLFELNPLMVL